MAPGLVTYFKEKKSGLKGNIPLRRQDSVISKYSPLVTQSGVVSQASVTRVISKLQPPPGRVAAATRARSNQVTSEDLYECRELMRLKYTLDVDIWAMRNVHRANIPIRDEKGRRSDGAMAEIQRRVGLWNNQAQHNWTPEEWELVQEIQKRVNSEPAKSRHLQNVAELPGDGPRRFPTL